MILILGLIAVGFGAGFCARRVLRHHDADTCRIYQTLKSYRIFRALWEHMELQVEAEHNIIPNQPTFESNLSLDRRSRRGRRPTYSIDRWMKVVLAWEKQDPWRKPLTLTEFLIEQFGSYADGSPRMSEKSYYEWRKKVYEELGKQEEMKKKISTQ
jgi:hypothetical protein